MKGEPRRSLPLLVLSKAEASKAEWAGMTREGNSCLHLVNYSCIMNGFSKRCCL